MNQHLFTCEVRLFAILLGLGVFLWGCSSSYTVSSAGNPNSEYSYQVMNQKLRGRDVRIELKDGRTISAKEVNLSYGSASGFDTQSDSTFSIPTNDINTIKYHNHWVGGAEGFGIGFIPGAVYGLAVG